ncbi:MAG TPA: hypothetical protein VHK91_10810 [Flavisolibacter sp.]|jgi:hypothetical protein|nr:hypothetical protein [Flavisolibacter sp.]
MKKIIGIGLVLMLGFGTVSQAQTVKKVTHSVKKGAKKVGNKTAEVASKGKARVADQKLDNRTGPNNETIYVDGKSRYYWIDKKGKRHFVTEASLKTKIDN